MIIRFLLSALCIVSMAWVSPARAQDGALVCAGGMGGAAAAYAQSHQREVRLGATRGYSIADVRTEGLEAVLGSVEARTAIAIFAESKGRHCVYIMDRTGFRAFGVTPEGTEPARTTIGRLLDEWRQGAGIVEGPVRGLRATTLADMPIRPRAKGASAEVLAGTGARLATVLFPGETRKSLLAYVRLVIMPYAGLGAVPYAALPLEPGRSLFVDRLAVSLSPGPRYFSGQAPVAQFVNGSSRCDQRAPAQGIVVLGDPVAPAKGGVLFPALPGARREAINVARQFGVTPQLGADAVRGAVLAASGKAEIIHIAAHGVANSSSPLDSYIALSDGPWTAGSIQRTCLNGTRIVILSACQTGLGGNHDGGIIGLGRAFIIAGAANVAMSLWSVDDAGTEVLMRHFTKALAKAQYQPDEALRQAMLETRRSHPQPFIWSAFTLMGGVGSVR